MKLRTLICLSTLSLPALQTGCGALVAVAIPDPGRVESPSENGEIREPADTEETELDTSALEELDAQYSLAENADIKWSARMAVNGADRFVLNDVGIAQLSQALQNEKVTIADKVITELTVRDASQDNLVLATNVQEVAEANADHKAIWEGECRDVSPRADLGARLFGQDETRAQAAIGICDFAGALLTPVLRITPQQKTLEMKQVVYTCENNISATMGSYISSNRNTCRYGYDALEGEPIPIIEIPALYAEGTEHYKTHMIRARPELESDSNGNHDLEMNFSKAPFGSNDHCHTVKVDFATGTAEGGVQNQRYTYKRSYNSNLNTWILEDSEQRGSVSQISRALGGSNRKTVKFYVFCDWAPTPTDLKQGNIIKISGN